MPEYVVPILGMEENGRTWDMRSTLQSAIGTASTLFRGKSGHLDGPFDDKLALRIVDEIMSNIDAYVSEQIKQHTLNHEAKRALILRREDWHDSPDAMVWAEKFCEQQRNYNKDEDDLKEGETRSIDPTDEGFMVSWFANAMAAATRPYENANAMHKKNLSMKLEELDEKHKIIHPESITPIRIQGRPVKDNPQA
jgi:hypothetical protein